MAKHVMDPRERFIHRDLSWLAFNGRVLEEADDARNPLLERARFLAIFVSNLDEFFMVRVAVIKNLIDSHYNRRGRFGIYPHELFDQVKKAAGELTKNLYQVYDRKVKKDLEKNQIYIRTHAQLNQEQKRFVKRYFDTTVFPIITPMAVDQGHPFPVLPSRTMAFAVSLVRKKEGHLAIIPIPKNVPRLIKLPSAANDYDFILLDEVLRHNLKLLFRGYTIKDFTLFRLIRDSELAVEEEFTPDLLKAIEEQVKKRPRAKLVRLEVESACSADLLETLCLGLDFNRDEVDVITSDMDLSFLFELNAQVVRPELCYPAFSEGRIAYENIYDKINETNFITHLPFQSFYPTTDLIRCAAGDPDVLAIKMTLYRADRDSAIIAALKEAAKNKKQVTVLVEIKARFDEEQNIIWARELEEAGCHVIYGIAGLKVHSKMALIVRREEGGIRRYVHLSTGNYNEKTARVYTDIGYFTSNDDFAKDISNVFNVITGYSTPSPWKRIVSSPTDLRKYFFTLIEREIRCQKSYRNGLIFAKMNSLEDPAMIDKLYAASQAGVRVRLIVRGICCLVPGLPGLSENIEVRSIVGRFLEHSRIFVFGNNSTPRVFLSSADWMRRNLDRRVELLFEIYKDDIKAQLRDMMDLYWKDNVKSRRLLPDRTYVRCKEGDEKVNAQEKLIALYGA